MEHKKIIAATIGIASLLVVGAIIHKFVLGGSLDSISTSSSPASKNVASVSKKNPPSPMELLTPDVKKLLLQGQQINGAFVVIKEDLNAGIDVKSLTPRYLKEEPAGWTITDDEAFTPVNKTQCDQINKLVHFDKSPSVAELAKMPATFGCAVDDSGNFALIYKHINLSNAQH